MILLLVSRRFMNPYVVKTAYLYWDSPMDVSFAMRPPYRLILQHVVSKAYSQTIWDNRIAYMKLRDTT